MQLTNEKLYELCKRYGAQAKFWRQKFIGLLPEVNRRRLYEEKGFSSIFEFAAKLAGLSQEQVRLALNLEKRLEDKPTLKNLLVNGEASINKLVRVVSIATPENEEDLAEKIKVLPTTALNTLVRDIKCQPKLVEGASKHGSKKSDGLGKPLFEDKNMYVHASPAADLTFQLSDDVVEELNELHAKGIDPNELLREMLKRRREEIAEKKKEIAAEAIKPTTSRYISVKIREILKKEHGEKCSIATCHKPSEEIHHSRSSGDVPSSSGCGQRFSLSQNHDPRQTPQSLLLNNILPQQNNRTFSRHFAAIITSSPTV